MGCESDLHLQVQLTHAALTKHFFLPSKNHGLHLILNDVVENGPAWESGVRAGDVIVTVNDWLIVLMDRPQVIWSVIDDNLPKYSSQRLFAGRAFF